jgi:exoribonuclease II
MLNFIYFGPFFIHLMKKIQKLADEVFGWWVKLAPWNLGLPPHNIGVNTSSANCKPLLHSQT